MIRPHHSPVPHRAPPVWPAPARHRVIVIDNYDSFTYNLFQLVGTITGHTAQVYRNDQVDVQHIVEARPTHIILSPGPGNPENPAYFGVCREVIATLGPTVPLLGVCLGHQGIAVTFGGKIAPAPTVMHGKTSQLVHDGSPLFAGVPSPFEAMRYHSLVIDEGALPDCLQVTSRTTDGVIMAVAHRAYPILGVQFHPESVGTRYGATLLANFLAWTAA